MSDEAKRDTSEPQGEGGKTASKGINPVQHSERGINPVQHSEGRAGGPPQKGEGGDPEQTGDGTGAKAGEYS